MSKNSLDHWDEFFENLDEIVKEERAKLPDQFKNVPRTWEELEKSINELPGDDPLTWVKFQEQNLTKGQNKNK